MKIILVANTSWYLYNFRKPLLNELISQGYEIHTISPKDDYTPKLAKLGITTYNINIARSGLSPFKDIQLLFSLIKLYRKIKPDIVHQFTVKPVIWGSIASKIFPKIRVINSIPGLGIVFKGNIITKKIVTILYKIAIQRKHKIIFQNPDDYNVFLDEKLVKAEQCSLILSSGVDTEYFKVTPSIVENNTVKFGVMARLLWSKGIGEFVEASHKIYNKYSNAEFIILGSPDSGSKDSIPYEWLEKVNSEYNYITWIKHAEDVRPFLNDIDVFVLPSYYPEGVPKSLIESASFSLPLITTDTPGCKEVVENKYNGYLIKPNDVDELVSSMQNLLADTTLRDKFGENSRELALRKFDVKSVNKRTIDLYHLKG
jgi:glycosyltransferase involved in cell wall biosynthesis